MEGSFSPELGTVAGEEISHRVGNILRPFAKRRNFNDDNVEPKEQVFPKLLFSHRSLQVPMSGRENAHINSQAVATTETLNRLFLKHAQQLRLRVGPHVANFIEENGAAICLLKATDPPCICAGKSTVYVPEELALQ